MNHGRCRGSDSIHRHTHLGPWQPGEVAFGHAVLGQHALARPGPAPDLCARIFALLECFLSIQFISSPLHTRQPTESSWEMSVTREKP